MLFDFLKLSLILPLKTKTVQGIIENTQPTDKQQHFMCDNVTYGNQCAVIVFYLQYFLFGAKYEELEFHSL